MVWSQQKPNLLPGVATAVGTIFKELGGAAAKPVTVAVEAAIKGLVAANQTLTTGGIRLPTLQYDQARDLVATVAQIAERPIVLFLGQWEKSPDPSFEAKTLNAFLHHLDDWPLCHVLMALRPDAPAFGIVEQLVAEGAEQALDALAAPPRRVTLPDHPLPFSPALEDAARPDAARIQRAVRDLL